jgi:hypothetical protein
MLNPRPDVIYRGWIVSYPDGEDLEILQRLGVKLGEYDATQGSFEDCEVTEQVLDKLDPYWGRFMWGLQVVGEHDAS